MSHLLYDSIEIDT
jgi:hypothetical protein